MSGNLPCHLTEENCKNLTAVFSAVLEVKFQYEVTANGEKAGRGILMFVKVCKNIFTCNFLASCHICYCTIWSETQCIQHIDSVHNMVYDFSKYLVVCSQISFPLSQATTTCRI